jgi:hypothetical protein
MPFKRFSSAGLKMGLFMLIGMIPMGLQAHVKWFTQGTYADKPMALSAIFSPLFFQMAALTLVVVLLGVWIDAKIQDSRAYKRIDQWLSDRSDKAILVLRITLAMTLLLSWQDGSMLVPNVGIKQVWIGWYQFVLTFLLIFPRTVPIAGLGVILLYGLGIANFSGFHMLDYALYLGVGWYLAVSRSSNMQLKKSGLMLLYLTVGFSLCWVALEKFIYPEWAIQIIEERNLNMGMDSTLFLAGAAFVEFGLGYLMLICMLQRPLAVLITLVFVTTTMVFGKVEIIGHTLLHGCLIVFLLEGRSVIYNRINRYIKSLPARMIFASVMLLVLFPMLLYPYSALATKKYENRMGKTMYGSHHEHIPLEFPEDMPRPTLELEVFKDPMGGYNLHLITTNFKFTPENAGRTQVFGEGHAHLYLNDEKIARVYGNWFYLPPLPQGDYDVEVTLNGNGHEMLTWGGEPIGDAVTIAAPKIRDEEMPSMR